MKCAWKELLMILPQRMVRKVDELGSEDLQELRLRRGKPPELVLRTGIARLENEVTSEEIAFVVNAASRYSPWSAATVSQGYLTAPGGHRIGMCGEATIKNGCMFGIRAPTSLCIRVARDFPGIASKASQLKGNILILGPPGSGKTTLLRDLIRQISAESCITVVDERGELFPTGLETGLRTDVLTGCAKTQGLSMALRTMGPGCIAVDEITAKEDCNALLEAGWCGVRLLATAHASCVSDLKHRCVYHDLSASGIFETAIVMRPDKSWRWERMEPCG